jgi:hypothetical protein
MPQPIDDDDTIRLRRPASPTARPPLPPTAAPSRSGAEPSRVLVRTIQLPIWAAVAAVLLVVLAGAGGWWLWGATPPRARLASVPAGAPVAKPLATRRASVPDAVAPQAPASAAATPVTVQNLPVLPPTAPGQAEFTIATATEQQILDHVPAAGEPDPTVFRFAPNPNILVLDFGSLLEQGRMLNRVAALIEKSGLPHDRVLTGFEIAAAIRASGDTVETYYYGHDYDAGSVLRFLTLANRDNIRLDPEEDQLSRLIRQAGWFQPNALGALISIPQVGANARVTREARATILHHELSHGEYFTNPAYAAFVHRFWTQTLTAAERDGIRRHLRSEGYDQNLEEVMENEAQAYLMFTDGAEFFTPEMIGMTPARLAELRIGFYRTMPGGWLRDSLGRTLGVNRTAADRP